MPLKKPLREEDSSGSQEVRRSWRRRRDTDEEGTDSAGKVPGTGSAEFADEEAEYVNSSGVDAETSESGKS